MVDWNSPAAFQASATAFMALLYAFTGAYTWEWVTSLDFEWDFIRGRRKFRWPLIAYFANRYLLFCALILLIIFFNAQSRPNFDCDSLYRGAHISGNIALGFASMNFAIRTMCIWMQNFKVTVILCLLVTGQWAVTIAAAHGVKAQWVPVIGCLVESVNYRWLLIVFVYNIFFDLVIVALNVRKIGVTASRSPKRIASLSYLLFTQGVIYFVIACLADTIEVVMIILNLNIVMGGIFMIPAHVLKTIVACRSVRSLNNYLIGDGNNIHMVSMLPFTTRTNATTNNPRRSDEEDALGLSPHRKSKSVIVRMDTFSHTDCEPSLTASKHSEPA